MLKIKNIRLRERYGEGEVPHEAKTGTGPILLTTSFPYVRDWLNDTLLKQHNARLICNLHNGAPIKPKLCTMMNQLKKRILRLIETSEIKEIVDRVNIKLMIVESIMGSLTYICILILKIYEYKWLTVPLFIEYLKRQVTEGKCMYCFERFSGNTMGKHLQSCKTRQGYFKELLKDSGDDDDDDKDRTKKYTNVNVLLIKIFSPFQPEFWLFIELGDSLYTS